MDKIECPICGEKMRFNESTKEYTCSSCGTVLKKDEIGEAKQVTKANNIISKKLTSLAVGAVAFISIMGLALSNKKLNLNTNKADNDLKTNNNHIEGITNSDNGIGYSLFEKIVVQEVEEENVTITLALPEGYKPVKIDGTYYGEMVIPVYKDADMKMSYVLPKDKQLDEYEIVDNKGVNKNNPEDTINLIAQPTYFANSGWVLSGSKQRKIIKKRVPATILNISLNKDFSKIIKK